MKKVVKMLILLLMMGSTLPLPGFSQEKKDIKMEVFKEDHEVLPFAAVDHDNRAVTDLEKREIVLLVNGRNFRGFSLVYPSSRCGQLPAFSNTPKHSCYDIVFLYTSEFGTTNKIRLGTSRKGVQLHTLKSLKISKSLTKLIESQNEITALKKENKVIPVQIIDADSPDIRSQLNAPKVQPQTPAANDTDTAKSLSRQPGVPSPEAKTGALKRLKEYQFNLTDTASSHYCESAINYLRQNRIKKALNFFAKMFEREGTAVNKTGWLPQLIEKIQRIDEASEKMLDKITQFSKTRASISIQTNMKKIDALLEKGKIKKTLSYLQELLDNIQVQIEIAGSALDHLPVILEIHQSPTFQMDRPGVLASLDQQVNYYREKLDLLKSSHRQLEDQVFVQAGRIKKILGHLEQPLSRDARQIELIKQRLSYIRDMNNKQHARDVITFVTANSNKFSAEYRNTFFKAKLEMLGVAKELIAHSPFFDVVTLSRDIYKNRQGFWEAVFPGGITMIYIPQGEFTMGVPWESGGAEDESPQHKVYLDSFWISKYEITFDQYDRFCQETGKDLKGDYGRGRKKRPVVGVSWAESQAFCSWFSQETGLHFRLPTEAEWEKAARGTDARKYPWGNNKPEGSLTNFADVKFLKKYLELNPPINEKERKQKTGWIDPSIDDGFVFTAPVGSYPGGASPYGVMDMAGNVWEWVLDWYDSDYYHRSPVRNPQKTLSGDYRVSRGGGWDCHPWLLRASGRAGGDPSKGNDALGFRLVCSNAFGDQGGTFY